MLIGEAVPGEKVRDIREMRGDEVGLLTIFSYIDVRSGRKP